MGVGVGGTAADKTSLKKQLSAVNYQRWGQPVMWQEMGLRKQQDLALSPGSNLRQIISLLSQPPFPHL